MSVDVERIERVFDQINEENLDMTSWAVRDRKRPGCGTTMCFAGHVVVEEGIEIDWYQDEDVWINPRTNQLETYAYWRAEQTKDGREIEDVAKELVGFDEDQANYVFYATYINDVSGLRERVNEAINDTMYGPIDF